MLDSLTICNEMWLQISSFRKDCVTCAAANWFKEGFHVADGTILIVVT